jgi:hypothetical protein
MEIRERSDETVVSRARGFVVDNGLSFGRKQVSVFSNPDVLAEVDGAWVVRNLETGIFGTGPDPAAAKADFENALREHLAVLEAQEALSEGLEAQREYLRRRLA